MNAPLAERLRPKEISEFIGQEHLLAPGKPIYQTLKNKKIGSMIFWGPPGTGKTTLSYLIAKECDLLFFSLSAIESGVKEIRQVIETAKKSGGALLFIDEIHRFSKSQQDALLGAVEKGIITLIGATTENPSFEVNSALLSRCTVYTLHALEVHHLDSLIKRALEKDEFVKSLQITIQESEALIRYSSGDARRLLNQLETLLIQIHGVHDIVTNKIVEQSIQEKPELYDKDGEFHYDIISAFIKSIRGSDPNAAVYYLVRMTRGGEDPVFISRRLLILASEDIGIANPNALLIANNCFQAVQAIGYPEAELILAQTTIYLATSVKSNSVLMSLLKAKELHNRFPNLPVPYSLRNSPTKLMKELGYGIDYKYAHDYPGNFVTHDFLPNEISGECIYDPQLNAKEQELRKYLLAIWGEKYKYSK